MENERSRSVVKTDKAPSAIGPYSQGIVAGDLLFISGQLPLNPATGEFVEGDIEMHTRQCLENVKAVAEAAGFSLDGALKMTVFLTDMADFLRVNRVYERYFPVNPPARSAVQVAALPKNATVEIEAIITLKQ